MDYLICFPLAPSTSRFSEELNDLGTTELAESFVLFVQRMQSALETVSMTINQTHFLPVS